VAEQLTISLEDAQEVCDQVYTTEALAAVAGERLRRAGYRVNRIVAQRFREDGMRRVAVVLHPDGSPLGELVAVPKPVPQQRRADPGEPR
jgi:hypothetical protein